MSLLTAACRPAGKTQPSAVEVKVGDSEVAVSRLHPGITHTQFSIHPSDQSAAVDASTTLISGKKLYQNQYIMGWGAMNPEPSPGVYDWESLDRRIELIRHTSGIPVITLCCAPDWMKGGAEGKTDWSKINDAPDPDHFDDFAALAGKVARRYPDVKHYQVWHGLKGFYDPKARNWDYQSFTDLYNAVYRELKWIDPTIKVGGPVVTVDSWGNPKEMQAPSKLKGPWGTVDQRALDAIAHWLKAKEGADFISLDLSVPNKDRVEPTNPFEATEKMATVAKWVKRHTDLPLWVARWNPFPQDAQDWGLAKQEALLATAYLQLARSGVEVALLWQPQAKGAECIGCLWMDTRLPAGGQTTSSFETLDALASNFSAGTAVVRTSTSSGDVMAVSTPELTVLVNQRARSQTVRLSDTRVGLDPFEVRLLPRAALKSG